MTGKSSGGLRSPLKQKPLRGAGDSVQAELDELVDRELIYVVLAP
jgi:hypothetical protein